VPRSSDNSGGLGAADQADWRDYREEPPLSAPLQAGLDAFVENGYHGTRVREIADRAGLSVPGLYHHYPSKEAILSDLLRFSISDLLRRSHDALDAVGDDPIERLMVLVENVVLYMANRSKFAFLGREVRNQKFEVHSEYVKLRRRQHRLIANELKAGHESGVFLNSHPNTATRAITGMCADIASWYERGGRVSPLELAERYVVFAVSMARFVGDTDAVVAEFFERP
jgi:AcrR family transcriptional regulator